MKKWLSVLLAMLMLLSLCAPAMAEVAEETAEDKDDSTLFIEEYTADNGTLDSSGLYMVQEIIMPEVAPFDYAEFDEVVGLLTEGTGMLYLGFPRCPWCRALVPAMMDAWEQSGAVQPISYFNPRELRPLRSVDEEGNVITEKPADPMYDKLVELLYDHLNPFEGSNDETIKHIYVPMVVFVRDGNIEFTHIGTVDGHDRGETLTEEEYTGLVSLLAEHMDVLKPVE